MTTSSLSVTWAMLDTIRRLTRRASPVRPHAHPHALAVAICTVLGARAIAEGVHDHAPVRECDGNRRPVQAKGERAGCEREARRLAALACTAHGQNWGSSPPIDGGPRRAAGGARPRVQATGRTALPPPARRAPGSADRSHTKTWGGLASYAMHTAACPTSETASTSHGCGPRKPRKAPSKRRHAATYQPLGCACSSSSSSPSGAVAETA